MSEQESSAMVAEPVVTTKSKPKNDEKRKRQPRYHVILWDDDDHSYEYVGNLWCLQRVDSRCSKQFPDRLDTLWRLVSCFVDERADFCDLQFLRRAGHQKLLQFLFVGEVCVEPKLLLFFAQKHRHAIVKRCHRFIGFGCKDCARLNRFGFVPKFLISP